MQSYRHKADPVTEVKLLFRIIVLMSSIFLCMCLYVCAFVVSWLHAHLFLCLFGLFCAHIGLHIHAKMMYNNTKRIKVRVTPRNRV